VKKDDTIHAHFVQVMHGPGKYTALEPTWLAGALADLSYDSLHELLDHLAIRLYLDAEKDADRGRKKLAKRLRKSSNYILEAAFQIRKAANIRAKETP